MLKLLAVILLCTACSSTSSAPPVPTGIACDEGHSCPEQQPCLYVSALGRHCCGGVACKADFFSCSSSAECGTDRKCEGGGCVPCETAGCQEVGDGGTGQADMRSAAGCKSGQGREISPTMHACLAIVTQPGEVRNQCAAGWSICKTNTAGADCEGKLPRDEVYIAEAVCGQPQGAPWVASKVVNAWSGLGSTYLRGIGGCGNGVGAISGPPSAAPPAGFQWAMECWESGHAPQIPGVVECPDVDFSNVRILHPKAGVLCCKN